MILVQDPQNPVENAQHGHGIMHTHAFFCKTVLIVVVLLKYLKMKVYKREREKKTDEIDFLIFFLIGGAGGN